MSFLIARTSKWRQIGRLGRDAHKELERDGRSLCFPAETGTFIELMEVGGEWYVRVFVEGRETINWFQSKGRALAFAEGWRKHLNLERIDML